MKKYILIIMVFAFVLTRVNAQIFSGSTGSIPNLGCIDATTTVIGVGTLTDVNTFNVSFTSNYSYDGDLVVTLESPAGTIVDLTSNNGGSGAVYQGTFFTSFALTSITAGSPNFKGTYLPEGNLTDFVGENMDGTWTLHVCDSGGNGNGSLQFWSLSFTQPSLQGDICSNPITLPVRLRKKSIIK